MDKKNHKKSYMIMNCNSDIAYHNSWDTYKSVSEVQPESHIQLAAYFYR